MTQNRTPCSPFPYVTTCLECGRRGKPVTEQHLQSHGLNVKAYREKYGIDPEASFAP